MKWTSLRGFLLMATILIVTETWLRPVEACDCSEPSLEYSLVLSEVRSSDPLDPEVADRWLDEGVLTVTESGQWIDLFVSVDGSLQLAP